MDRHQPKKYFENIWFWLLHCIYDTDKILACERHNVGRKTKTGIGIMTRNQAIELLNETTIGDEIGIGGYKDSAAYKLANGDISAATPGLSDDVVEAIKIVGKIEFEEIGR